MEDGVASRDDDEVVADHRHHRRVAGEAGLGDRCPEERGVLAERDLDQTGPTALEGQQPDEGADRDGLLHERGEQVRSRHRHVDTPRLVEQPLVLGVVDPGEHPGDAELLLGQQRDDEVVLVVAGDRDEHVGRLRARPAASSDTSQASATTQSTRSRSSRCRMRSTRS